MRIDNHPVLGQMEERKAVMITVNGREIRAFKGEAIAAAITAAGLRAFRKTPKLKEPRGFFCAIGRCTDCVMVVDGQPNVRTCVTPVREGMDIRTQIGLGTWRKKS